KLPEVVHCRNCEVFSLAARQFFRRPAPEGYRDDWAKTVAEPPASEDRSELSVIVFRLAQEWLAVDTEYLAEATDPQPVHRVPHRKHAAFRGLVNIRGRLMLCASLEKLLGVEPLTDRSEIALGYHVAAGHPRMIVLSRGNQSWVIESPEVVGVTHAPRNRLQSSPAANDAAAGGFCRAILPWDHRTVAVLCPDRLFDALAGISR
ncbi:MAG TPA: chemotaxis protein CheW, partial [Pirellulales bacterium]